jgi:hypothetical protein
MKKNHRDEGAVNMLPDPNDRIGTLGSTFGRSETASPLGLKYSTFALLFLRNDSFCPKVHSEFNEVS